MKATSSYGLDGAGVHGRQRGHAEPEIRGLIKRCLREGPCQQRHSASEERRRNLLATRKIALKD
jgi:hypothetical protein